MKKMKKFLSIILTVVMVLAMAAPAFAATITVNTSYAGEKYSAYKIFDVTKVTGAEDKPGEASGYAYTINKNSQWKQDVEGYTVKVAGVDENVFQLTEAQDDPTTLIVSINEKVDFNTTTAAEAFAEYLASKLNGKTADDTATSATVTGTDEIKATFKSDLAEGYYFVTTGLGSLCILDTTDVEITEKNIIPSLVKKIVVDDKELDTTTAKIGDTVNYKITVTDGKGTNEGIIVYDLIESGLTLDMNTVKVQVMGTDALVDVDEQYYTVDSKAGEIDNTKYSFKITLNADYVASLDENDEVYITYSAMLNDKAEIVDDTVDGSETNDNTAWLTYSKQKTEEDTVTVVTYKFGLIKTDKDGKILSGAKFKMYDKATEGNEIKLFKNSDGTYRPALEGETAVEVEAGNVVIQGLGNDTYYLEETAAPAGYNKLEKREYITIDASNNLVTVDENSVYVGGGLRVINNTGTQLPSTGGIGTTIFYLAGIILMAGAVFFVIRSRKNSSEN
ncbi:MAG: SpaH/EbpB family LPXTG-anchored major pilin [Eubacteriales bacterium]|nr:SpaH/EbpB family LPXTG-anchored major pilin [Eubacteriales bacterium]